MDWWHNDVAPVRPACAAAAAGPAAVMSIAPSVLGWAVSRCLALLFQRSLLCAPLRRNLMCVSFQI